MHNILVIAYLPKMAKQLIVILAPRSPVSGEPRLLILCVICDPEEGQGAGAKPAVG